MASHLGQPVRTMLARCAARNHWDSLQNVGELHEGSSATLCFGVVRADVIGLSTLPPKCVRVAASFDDFARLLSDPTATVVLGFDGLSDSEAGAAVQLARFSRLPIVIRIGQTSRSVERMLVLREHIVGCRISVFQFDDLRRDVVAACSGASDRDITPRVINRLMVKWERHASSIVASAVAIGWCQRSVCELGQLCDAAPRTLNRRLANAGVISAARLLNELLCVHAAWRLDVLGWSVKRTASTCGFVERTHFDNFIRYHTAHTPADLAARHRFEALFDALPESVDARRDSLLKQRGGLSSLKTTREASFM